MKIYTIVLLAYLIAITCNEPPEGHVRWTLSLLADRMVECKYFDSVSRVK